MRRALRRYSTTLSKNGGGWTPERLKAEGFSEEIVNAVDGVTRRLNESYEEFIDRLSDDALAREVKLADLEDNMNVLRLDELTPNNLERFERYHRAWKKLRKNSEGH